MKKSFEIESDCLDIVKRVKSIDGDYFIVRNVEKNVFELHNHSQAFSSYCLTLPFDVLDERTVSYVLKTRVQNCDTLFEEIENQNEKIKLSKVKEVLNDFEEKMNDC